ncbi:membrane protease YdiL (CAAX protease family) [Rhodovulum iodosum]|uniref:Membrane protease YdiL (CAAX protease family) n=1 Tax=Rhodovulum iodosum TaxID=68291 RepID=A0ABV3Y0E7_9RHOB|nr:CPBP family intramembrane glutamic endopeptidase [Rhodovulum robiginosum]
MRAPEFEDYIAPARVYPELWRLFAGLLVMLLIYTGATIFMVIGLVPVLQAPLAVIGWLQSLTKPTEPGQTLFLLATFLGMGLGVVVATQAMHFRGVETLFGPRRETMRDFFRTLQILVPVYALLLAIGWLIERPEANLAPGRWLMLLPIALPLLFVQIASEEMLFRGYLQQQLAARFAARVVWMGLPAVLFSALHYNPEAGMTNVFVLISILIFALAAADLTERTGSLGAAMGWHFVNNFGSLLVLSVKGTINGLSLFVTPYDVSEQTVAPIGLALEFLTIIVMWRLLRALL